jgi:hypothetical protein
MDRRSKKKFKPKQRIQKTKLVPTNEKISETEFHGDNKISLKITVRKGARIESVPKKKLEKLATKQTRYWKLENDWLILYGLP